MNFKASVIVPVYNAADTLTRCVESIIFGTFRDLQVILVDDVSTDRSWSVCRSLSDTYANVVCFQNERNSGVSSARNRGLKEARGEYIMFVDSDDWVSGHYAEKLIAAAEKDPEALPICGLHFYEEVAGYKRDYVWREGGEPVYLVAREQFFDLQDKFHLQQIWNKVFRRDIIERTKIRFDESQSMGEDYQFVLDYMEAAHIERCLLLNEPLYYYIRANTSSLMSQFGLVETQNEKDRLRQLLKLSGPDQPETIKKYGRAVESSKLNSVYQAVHCDRWTKAEKLEFIETVMQDGQAQTHFRKQAAVRRKEKLVEKYRTWKSFLPRVRGRLQRKKRDRLIRKMRSQLQNRDLSIISQNCIGGVFYHDMGLQFSSPTINLYFKCPDFVKFVLHLDYYLGQDLNMTWGEEYPIGYLDDIAIYFQHYHTCSEAKKKWEERKLRINRKKIMILSTDMEQFTDETFEQWEKILYPKVLFTATARPGDGVVYYPEYAREGRVPDLIPARRFYKDEIIINVFNKSI